MSVQLRPFRQADVELLVRFATDPSLSEPFQWFGFAPSQNLRRRWEEDGLLGKDPHHLAIVESDAVIGWVMWRQGSRRWSGVVEIGAVVAPEHRGRGAGTAAQHQLVEYLFATTPVHRIWAGTEVDNMAEQRALEKCGFQREGVLRQNVFRGGEWRDSVIYGLLRTDSRQPTR